MTHPPKNNHQHYLPEEDELIKAMSLNNEPNWVIAQKLGRSEGTIYYRRRLLKVPSGPTPTSSKYKRMKALAAP